ncbi:MAG: fibronectin type III domain-containing protein, partial [Candidatus Kerfeldbacteria bacterium]|nr:fibronectin type III domain-containing protein [Candidatus Kerfeldbacteria bacterium]
TTSSSATLTWATNEAATTQLEWGTTASYGNTTTLDAALVTSHSVQLTGLAANTTFHARALSTDAAANAATSSDLAFTTSSTAATVITNVQVTKNSSTSVTITWTTNEAATSKVRYGLSTDYGSEVSDLTPKTSHSLIITGLTPNTTYHYEVISTGTTTDNDADATFTTPTETAATVISNVRVIAGETIATFFWTTNEAATSKVRLGTTTSYGTVRSQDERVTDHRLQVKGLQAGTTYHYHLQSIGSTTVTTADATFTTNTAASTVGRAIPPTLLTPILKDGADPTLTLTGVAKGGQTVRIFLDGQVVATVRLTGSATKTRSFSAVIDLSDVADGKHTVYAQSTDAVGRTSLVKQRLTIVLGGTPPKPVVKVKKTSQYTVQSGDSLWRLAERYLGDGRQFQRLVDANADAFPSLLTNPRVILPGWTLTIPPG